MRSAEITIARWSVSIRITQSGCFNNSPRKASRCERQPTLSEPSKEFEAVVAAGEFFHYPNDCVDFQINSVETKPTSDGRLIRPVKGTPNGRIDAIVAQIIAVALALSEETVEPAVW